MFRIYNIHTKLEMIIVIFLTLDQKLSAYQTQKSKYLDQKYRPYMTSDDFKPFFTPLTPIIRCFVVPPLIRNQAELPFPYARTVLALCHNIWTNLKDKDFSTLKSF